MPVPVLSAGTILCMKAISFALYDAEKKIVAAKKSMIMGIDDEYAAKHIIAAVQMNAKADK